LSYGPQGQPPLPPPPFIEQLPPRHGPSPWELIVAGFWLAIGFMAASAIVGLVLAVALSLLGRA